MGDQREQEDAAILRDIRARAADRLERLEAEEAKNAKLRAALDQARKQFQDELLSDEAVEAAWLRIPDLVDAAAVGGEKDALRSLFKAALASINQKGGE
jgi:hypothetical protein